MLIRSLTQWLALCLVAHRTSDALTLEATSATSIKDAASQVAYGMMKYYTGNETGGVVRVYTLRV